MSDPVENELVDVLDDMRGDFRDFEQTWGDRS